MTSTEFEGPGDEDDRIDAEPIPTEADPADVEEQRQEVGDGGEEEYR